VSFCDVCLIHTRFIYLKNRQMKRACPRSNLTVNVIFRETSANRICLSVKNFYPQ